MGKSFKEFQNLNQVSSVSLLLPPHRPSPTKGFLSWLGALRWHGPSRRHPRKLLRNPVVVKIGFFHLTTTGFLGIVSVDDYETARVNKGRRVSSKSRWRGARRKKTDETRLKFSNCREEFSGLKKASGKKFGHHGRIFTPEPSSPQSISVTKSSFGQNVSQQYSD